jgi:hypothetical protein
MFNVKKSDMVSFLQMLEKWRWMPNYPRIVACLLDRQGGDKSAKIDSAFIFF